MLARRHAREAVSGVGQRLRRRLGAGLVAACSVSACAGAAAAPARTGIASASPDLSITTPLPTPTPRPVPTPVPLAGPLVVQVENASDARPQSGMSGAAIAYEYVAEGGITRFSLVFLHMPGTQVGPVRSAREAAIEVTQLYHGALIFSGASQGMTARLRAADLPRYDETSARGDLFRIRTRYAPHNLYTDGAHLADLSRRAALPPATYELWDRSADASDGTPATVVTVRHSAGEVPQWTYDAPLHGYVRSEHGVPFIDAGTGHPLMVGTLVVQQVPVRTLPDIEDINGAHGLAYTLTGSGAAQVFTRGRQYSVRWTQPAGGGPPQLTQDDGSPAPIAPGLVWISLLPTGTVATAS